MGLPEEFEILYSYVRGLDFSDLPDYEGLRRLFRALAEKKGIKYDGMFDWIRPKHIKEASAEGAGKTRRCRACEACSKAREEGRS